MCVGETVIPRAGIDLRVVFPQLALGSFRSRTMYGPGETQLPLLDTLQQRTDAYMIIAPNI